MICDLTSFTTGFCDRLRQITFCAALGHYRGDRTVAVRTELTADCPYDFVSLIRLRGFELTEANGTEPGPVRMTWRDSFPLLENVKKHRPADLAVTDAEFLAQWIRSYQCVEIHPRLQARLDAVTERGPKLGLHVRRTDMMGKPDRLDERQVKEIDRLIERGLRRMRRTPEYQAVFLAADDGENKRQWASRLAEMGYDCVFNPAQFDRTKMRQTSGEDFVLDLFGLARCDAIVAGGPSGVYYAACWINGRTALLSYDQFRRFYALRKLARTVLDRVPRKPTHSGPITA